MTTTAKTTRRETLSSVRQQGKTRAIVLILKPMHCEVRLKGMRHTMAISYDQIFTLAARTAAEALRRERAEKRKARSAKA